MNLDCVLSSLQQLQYFSSDNPITASKLQNAVDGGVSCGEFRQLVHWLVDQLNVFAGIEETVSRVGLHDNESAEDFLLEVSSVLIELRCAHPRLTDPTSSPAERLSTAGDRAMLLDFLCGEVQAARILLTVDDQDEGVLAQEPAQLLKTVLMALEVPRPPDSVTMTQLFDKLCARVTFSLGMSISSPLWSHKVNGEQWRAIEHMQTTLQDEYTLRRRLLLTRLDVTMQSFKWSPTAEIKQDELAEAFVLRRGKLRYQPSSTLAGMRGLLQLMVADKQLAVDERLCSSRLRQNTSTPLNKVLIGPVPDRGGRPSQQAAPPPEMPSWKPRQTGFAPGARGRGCREGVNRVQGSGWNRPTDRNTNRRRY